MKKASLLSSIGFGAAMVLAQGAAQASVAWHGVLSSPHFMGNGVVLVYTAGSRSNIPACGISQPARFAVDSTTPSGRSQLAGLLTAFASGKQVVIVGNDTCSVYSDSETINYFYIAE
jgi:hypothetical protein